MKDFSLLEVTSSDKHQLDGTMFAIWTTQDWVHSQVRLMIQQIFK